MPLETVLQFAIDRKLFEKADATALTENHRDSIIQRRLKQFSFCPSGFVQGAEAALQGLDKDNLGSGFDYLEEKYRDVSKLLYGNE
jgi:hypothetical protein